MAATDINKLLLGIAAGVIIVGIGIALVGSTLSGYGVKGIPTLATLTLLLGWAAIILVAFGAVVQFSSGESLLSAKFIIGALIVLGAVYVLIKLPSFDVFKTLFGQSAMSVFTFG